MGISRRITVRRISISLLLVLCMGMATCFGMAGEPSNNNASIQQIRNATLKIKFGGKTILVDPMLAPKDAFPPIPETFNPTTRFPLVDLPVSVDELLKVDAVIVTHLHPDHFDEVAAKAIPKDMPIIAQDETDAEILRGYGFINVNTLKYEGTKIGEIIITKTDCIHGEKKAVMPYYDAFGIRWEASGFILRHPDEDKVIYVAGDTIWSDGVRYALKYFKPDVVVVNVAGAQFLTSGPIIMQLSDLVEIIRATPDSTTIVASHLDAVSHATVTRRDVRKLVNDYSFTKVLIPEDGESITF